MLFGASTSGFCIKLKAAQFKVKSIYNLIEQTHLWSEILLNNLMYLQIDQHTFILHS